MQVSCSRLYFVYLVKNKQWKTLFRGFCPFVFCECLLTLCLLLKRFESCRLVTSSCSVWPLRPRTRDLAPVGVQPGPVRNHGRCTRWGEGLLGASVSHLKVCSAACVAVYLVTLLCGRAWGSPCELRFPSGFKVTCMAVWCAVVEGLTPGTGSRKGRHTLGRSSACRLCAACRPGEGITEAAAICGSLVV